jgi:hypothetical protein
LRDRHLVVLALVALVLSTCQPPAIVPSATASGTTGTSDLLPSASAPPAIGDVGFDEYRWQQAAISIEPHAFLTSVASTSLGWVAVGVRINLSDTHASFAPDSDPFAKLYSGVVWISPDGRTWTRHADGPEFDGARMTRILANGSGALAFGLAGVCLPDACGGLPPNGGTIVWSSLEGAIWERLTETGLSEGATTDVIPTDDGLVAVGFVANNGSKPDAAFSAPTDAAVWRSVDGHEWTAVANLPVADQLSRVSAQGSRLMAVGSSGGATVVWSSDDGGLTWREGPRLDDDCCISSSAIRKVFAVVATSTDAEPTLDGVIHSLDPTSASWTTVSPPKMHGYRPALVQVLGASFVVFGWTVHRDSDDLLKDDLSVAFESLDGAAWTQATLPAEWAGKAPSSVAGRGRDLAAIVGPLETLNGPPDVLTQTMWLGTAPD